MKLSSISARGVVVLALALLAGCKDSTGIDTSVGGDYQLASGYVFSFDDGQTTRQTLPVVLYEGQASDGNATYDIRYEVTGARMTLDEQRKSFAFSGTYRLVETKNRFPAETLTVSTSGTYSLSGSDLTLTLPANPEVDLNRDATLYNGKLSVEVIDPVFGLENLYELRK